MHDLRNTGLNEGFRKRVFITTGHCDSEEKENVAVELIRKIRKRYSGDYVFASHIPPTKKIIDLVDYVVYIKENLIENAHILNDVTQQFGLFLYNMPYKGTVIRINCPNHGWAHHQLMSTSLRTLDHRYENYHFVNYDAHHSIVNQILKHEVALKEHDGFFYNFKDTDQLNTECYSINDKIRKKIESKRKYEDYYNLGHYICENNYTNMVQEFDIYRAGPYPYTEDHEIGSIKFTTPCDYIDINRPIGFVYPDFEFVPYKEIDGQSYFILRILNDCKIVLRMYKNEELIKENKYVGKSGIFYFDALDNNCVCKIEYNGKPFLAFDTSKEYNYGIKIS